MTFRDYIIPQLPLVVGVVLLSAFTHAAEVPMRTLEGLVGQWVELRGQIAAEQRDWESQSVQWRQEMDLLKREQEQLTVSLARLEEAGETQQERSADLLQRRERLRKTIDEVESVVQRLHLRVSLLASLVPPSLMTADLALALQAESSGRESAEGVSARLQRVLAALAVIEALQARVHVTRTMIALPDEPRREMDVLFLGLAAGYAVTADGRLAAVGRSTVDGWRWTRHVSGADVIRRMIDVAGKAAAPELVTFPVGIATAARGTEE